MSAFNSLADAIVDVLQASPAVSASVTRNRVRPLPDGASTGVVVRIISSVASRMAVYGAPVLWDTQIGIECYARSSTLSPDEATDALMAAVYARMAADDTLSGLVQDINVQAITWTQDAADKAIGCAVIEYQVRHRTASNTLT